VCSAGTEGVLQAVVTLKHWMAYSIEGNAPEDYNHTRTNIDVNVSAYDLASTYFPAWEATIKEGHALGIMCSYNMVNGKPTCGNPALNKTLREDWGFEGYITSDSDSCGCIWSPHHYAPTKELATRDCLQGGTDIDSGRTYLENLANAVTEGNMTRPLADIALYNTYRIRMRLGLFEPHKDNKYKHIGLDQVGTPASNAMSLSGAKQAMVLLKNTCDGGKCVLPFSAESGQKIAVIGQSVNTYSYYTG
jgi:beta-glucosidase-like glycosyl hydrolase